MASEPTADRFVERLARLAPPAARAELRRAQRSGRGSTGRSFGIRTGSIFELAKEFVDLPPVQIEKLLDSPVHEIRVGALSVMDKQARRSTTPEERRKELFDLYLRRTDAIDSWDLVDLGAPHVVGRYLWEKSRKPLYRLARSKRPSERRTAIVSTLFFVRKGDVGDTFELAKLLLHDDDEYVQKATGGLLREAGKREVGRLRSFLDEHAARMARTTLSYATELLTKDERDRYRSMRPRAGAARATRRGSTRER